MSKDMKQCACCKLSCDTAAPTCPACGEASWAKAAVVEEQTVELGSSPPAPSRPSRRRRRTVKKD